MKKTQKDPQPQFVRERATFSNSGYDPMKLGSVYPNGRKRNKRNRQKRQLTYIIACFAILSVFVLFFALKDKDGNKNISSITSSNLAQDSSLISDSSSTISVNSIPSSKSANSSKGSSLNTTPLSSEERAQAFKDLQNEITAIANEFNGRIGVYYVNLKNGENWGIGEKEPFVAASSIKLGINTLLYRKVSEGAYKFTDMLTYNNKPYPQGDMEPGTGSIIGQPNGTKFSIRRTSQLSITISDNCATNMVIRKLGGIDAVVPYLTGISGEVPYRTPVTYTDYKGALLSGRHRTSAKDLAMHAKNLYTLWTANKVAYDPLMTDLKSTVFKFGIGAQLPKSVLVAHKIGTNGAWKTENDVGIVFAKEPYAICVTTENPSQQAGRDIVSEISLMFYNYVTSVSK